MSRDLFIHVGASKSGTSSLQSGLTSSLPALAEAGLGIPFPRRQNKLAGLLKPLGWQVVTGFPDPVDPTGLDKAVRRLKRCRGDRLLLTVEDLAEMDEGRIGELMGRIEKDTQLRPHVIVTMRDWTKQLPSEWQQQLKRRLTTDYLTYLGEVRDHAGEEAELFRVRQDLGGICARWGSAVPADRIHVVPVGGAGQDRDDIFQRVAEVVGLDHTVIERPTRSVNRSYGLLECEVLRRLNVALGDRLTDIRGEYNPGVRRVLAQGALSRQSEQRVTLPPEHLPWVRAEMERQVAELRAMGVQEHGSIDLLVPDDSAAAPLPVVDEAEVARVAIDTFASFATNTFKVSNQLRRDLRRAERREQRRTAS